MDEDSVIIIITVEPVMRNHSLQKTTQTEILS